jgi:hypothetical protein
MSEQPKPTSLLDVMVLLGPEFSKCCIFEEQSGVVIVRLKRRVGSHTFATLQKKISEMGGERTRRGYEVPLV